MRSFHLRIAGRASTQLAAGLPWSKERIRSRKVTRSVAIGSVAKQRTPYHNHLPRSVEVVLYDRSVLAALDVQRQRYTGYSSPDSRL